MGSGLSHPSKFFKIDPPNQKWNPSYVPGQKCMLDMIGCLTKQKLEFMYRTNILLTPNKWTGSTRRWPYFRPETGDRGKTDADVTTENTVKLTSYRRHANNDAYCDYFENNNINGYLPREYMGVSLSSDSSFTTWTTSFVSLFVTGFTTSTFIIGVRFCRVEILDDSGPWNR